MDLHYSYVINGIKEWINYKIGFDDGTLRMKNDNGKINKSEIRGDKKKKLKKKWRSAIRRMIATLML